MSKRTDRLGFVAPQATEFGQRVAAWRSAVADADALEAPRDQSQGAQGAYERQLELAVLAEDAAAEAIIGTPAETTADIAQKVDVMYRRWVGRGSLADAGERRKVAALHGHMQQTTEDMAQCLLALYIDLTGAPVPSPRDHPQHADKPSPLAKAYDRFMVAAAAHAEWHDVAMETLADGEAYAKASELHGSMAAARRDMLAVPARTPADLAKKMAAGFYMVEGIDFDPATEKHSVIEASGNPGDLALLACYRDAVAMDPGAAAAPIAGRAEWDEAWGVFSSAKAVRDTLFSARSPNEDLGDDYTAAAHATDAAAERLLNTRAPDAAALADKTRELFGLVYAHRIGDDEQNPITLARYLASWNEFGGSLAASTYLDALWLKGERSGLVTIRPATFNARQWLRDFRRDFGGWIFDQPEHPHAPSRYVVKTDEAETLARAVSAWQALAEHERQLVEMAVDAMQVQA